MAEGRGAVFLSYESQDGDVARRICEALKVADIEVRFDPSELRGAMRGFSRSGARSAPADRLDLGWQER